MKREQIVKRGSLKLILTVHNKDVFHAHMLLWPSAVLLIPTSDAQIHTHTEKQPCTMSFRHTKGKELQKENRIQHAYNTQ